MTKIYVNKGMTFGGATWLEEVGSHTHTFNREDSAVSDEGYFACNACNLISKHEHKLEPVTTKNSNKHYLQCGMCTYRTADCYNVSYIMKDFYGHSRYCVLCKVKDIGDTTHSLGQEVSLGSGGHSKICAKCDYEHLRTPHAYPLYKYYNNSYHRRVCFVCGYAQSENHFWSFPTSWTKVGTSLECRKEISTCNTCGGKKAQYDTLHNYGSNQSQGSAGHAQVCTDCGYKPYTMSHLYGGMRTITHPITKGHVFLVLIMKRHLIFGLVDIHGLM